MSNDAWRLAAAALMTFSITSAPAQTVAKIDFESVGRAWPLAADMNEYHMTGATVRRTVGNPAQRTQIPFDPRRDSTTGFVGSARGGERPSGVEALPVDLFNARPFVYQRDGGGYLLYSVGGNGTDVNGSNEQLHILKGIPVDELVDTRAQSPATFIPNGADDISIRVPRPAFKLPELSPPPGEL